MMWKFSVKKSTVSKILHGQSMGSQNSFCQSKGVPNLFLSGSFILVRICSRSWCGSYWSLQRLIEMFSLQSISVQKILAPCSTVREFFARKLIAEPDKKRFGTPFDWPCRIFDTVLFTENFHIIYKDRVKFLQFLWGLCEDFLPRTSLKSSFDVSRQCEQ